MSEWEQRSWEDRAAEDEVCHIKYYVPAGPIYGADQRLEKAEPRLTNNDH